MHRWFSCFALLLILNCNAAYGGPTPPADELLRAEQLLKENEPAKALATARDFRNQLPRDRRLFLWRTPLGITGGEPRAIITQRVIYVAVRALPGETLPFFRRDDRPIVPADPQSRDYLNITALDATTGEPLWTRRAAPGVRLGVDDATSDLYLLGDQSIRFHATTGDTQATDPPADVRVPVGLTKFHATMTLPEGTFYADLGPQNLSTVSRIDSRFTYLWKTRIPFELYRPGAEVLPDNGSPSSDWVPLTHDAGQHAGPVAVAADGTLHFLDPSDGEITRSRYVGRRLLTNPVITDSAVIVISTDVAYAIPRAVFEDSGNDTEINARLLEARALLALGQEDEAAAVIEPLLGAVMQRPELYELAAEIDSRTGHEDRFIAESLAAMDLRAARSSPQLRERFGLIARIATHDQIVAPLVRADEPIAFPVRRQPQSAYVPPDGDPRLYFANISGHFFALNPRTLSVDFARLVDEPLRSLRLTDPTLPTPYRRRVFIELTPNLPEASLILSRDPRWTTLPGGSGPMVFDGHRHYIPLPGGALRVLDGGVVTERPAHIVLKSWELYLGPGGPLAVSEGSVYSVDRDLLPAQQLFTVPAKPPFIESGIESVAASDEAIAVLVHDTKAPREYLDARPMRLEIWSRQTHQRVAVAPLPLGPPDPLWHAQWVVPLGSGFVCAGPGLLYLDPAGNRWSFATGSYELPAGPLRSRFEGCGYFGNPIVLGDRLFVTGGDGALYVFDDAFITKDGRRPFPAAASRDGGGRATH
ncbi:MAG TPA: hypothetical protein VH253_07955 [Phycisphaerae bacterium]|nr:hypothetical protein [Phycisphaerae bacterium]